MSPPRAIVTQLAGVGLLLCASVATAAPCGRPDVDFAFPPDDASNVPGNAQLSAHYASPALYDDEPVTLTGPTGDELSVSVLYDEAQSMLRVSPEEPLVAGFHQVAWPGLRSVSRGGVGRGSTIGFFVDDAVDTMPPRFSGLQSIDWDLSRDRDPCLDGLSDRFVFELELGEVDDDGGLELLSVLVFETVDPAEPERNEPSQVALRPVPASGKLELRRPAQRAGKTCFAAVVQDLLGGVSGGGEVEVCTKTRRPPFFEGCAVGGAVGANSTVVRAWVFATCALGLLLLRRGLRARTHPARASD
jgi:hypothetical protein